MRVIELDGVFLEESVLRKLKRAVSVVVSSIVKSLKSLSFGQTKKIPILISRNLQETAGGGLLNKQLGEYAEHVAAHVLEEELYNNGLEVTNYGAAANGRKAKLASMQPDNRGRTKGGWQYGSAELKFYKPKMAEYTKAGELIGKEMFNSIISSGDAKLSSYEIVTAGVAEAKVSTADLIVKKKTKGEVTDLIRASLKVYAGDKIQFYNTGVVSVLFKLLGYEEKASAKNFINAFPDSKEKVELITRLAAVHREQYNKYKELKKVDPTIKNFKMATDFVNNLVRTEKLGSQATQVYADFLEEMFTTALKDKKKKLKIVENVFDKMDLSNVDASSVIYAVIYGDKKLSNKVIRSDTSPKFDALVKTELANVDVKVRRHSKIGMFLDFKLNGELLFAADFFIKAGTGLQIGAKLTDIV